MKYTTVCIMASVLSMNVMTTLAQTESEHSMLTTAVPIELRCEYLVDPLGIDETTPRLSWIIQASPKQRVQKQTAYQIIVASSEKKLNATKGDLWNSGKVESDQSNQIEYGGKALTSRVRCFWKVRIWDKDKKVSSWSKPAYWTMGLLNSNDWNAEWIGSKAIVLTGDAQKDSVARLMVPSPLLRKSFINKNRIARATMYVTALGLYEVRLNGKKVGDHVLAPEWTDYNDRIQYQTYDVTSFIKSGENVLSAMLADGWYVGAIGCFSDLVINRGRNYGSLDRRLLLQLELETSDGRSVQIVSDESWRINPDGPIRSADIYLGETYDSRKALKGWELAGFDDSKWDKVSIYPTPLAPLVSQMNEPVRVVRELASARGNRTDQRNLHL